jgi:hypothetical protein
VRADAVGSGVIEFASQETSALDIRGRYVLAGLEEQLKDGWQVTLHWTDR